MRKNCFDNIFLVNALDTLMYPFKKIFYLPIFTHFIVNYFKVTSSGFSVIRRYCSVQAKTNLVLRLLTHIGYLQLMPSESVFCSLQNQLLPKQTLTGSQRIHKMLLYITLQTSNCKYFVTLLSTGNSSDDIRPLQKSL